jgi:hypothetical protein
MRGIHVLQRLSRSGGIGLVATLSLAWSAFAARPVLAAISLSEAPASRAVAVSGVAPVLLQPVNMAVNVGETGDQELRATDLDGDPLTFSMVSGPAYMTVTTVDALAGIGNLHLAPGSGDVGGATGVIRVTDGALDAQKSLSISVLEIPPAGTPIRASLDLQPNTIDANESGRFETGYLQLPVGIDPTEVDITAVRLAGSVPAIVKTTLVADRNGDGVPELMIKFRRDALVPYLTLGIGQLTVTGTLVSGASFEGSDLVNVVALPDQPLSSSVSPNPLNPAGTLKFYTSKAGTVSIKLFDIRGRLVRRVLESRSFEAGSHEIPIDGRGEAGQPLASGTYYYRVETPGGNVTGRFAVLK